MGFLIKRLSIYVSVILLIVGCGKSLIKIVSKPDQDPYPMFGKTPSKNFFVPVTVSDSLRLKWEADTYGSFTNSSVVVYDDHVFTSDLGGRIFVFNINDGKKVGMLKSGETVPGTPLIYESLLIYAAAEDKDNLTDLVYYDYANGKQLYYEEIDSRVLSEMIALKDGIIFLTENGRINRYDLNGNSIWQTETKERTRSSPSLLNNVVVFGNDAGEIITVNAKDGNIINRFHLGGIFNSCPNLENETAFLSNNNGKIYSINFNTGKSYWEYNTGERIIMTPAADNENIYVGNLEGTFFSLNKKSGEPNWKRNYNGLFNATPLITNNRIIISDLDRSFYILDKLTGDIKNKYSLDGRAKLTPVFADSTLFIGYDRGILNAYEFIY
jgi:outer membrane protein assembly factor BamB